MAHADRLANLRRVVEKIAASPETLDMNRWQAGEKACLFGHACQDAWHNEHGLAIKEINAWPWFNDASRGAERKFNYVTPVFTDSLALEAASRFYSISNRDAEWLFLPRSYDCPPEEIPATALRRIADLIANDIHTK